MTFARDVSFLHKVKALSLTHSIHISISYQSILWWRWTQPTGHCRPSITSGPGILFFWSWYKEATCLLRALLLASVSDLLSGLGWSWTPLAWDNEDMGHVFVLLKSSFPRCKIVLFFQNCLVKIIENKTASVLDILKDDLQSFHPIK
jgi:hypothetical protein